MKVISFAFFKSDQSRFEQQGAGAYRGSYLAAHWPIVLRACAANFPGWQVRIHHDDSIWSCEYGDVLVALHDAGRLKLVDMGKCQSLCGSMLWRMAPAWDPQVEAFICRDLDSVPSPRDRRVVEEWLDSRMTAHAIHDHHYHVGTPFMGGMIGFRPEPFRNATGLMSLGDFLSRAAGHKVNLNQHGADQHLLNLVLWDKLKSRTMLHQLRATTDEGAAKMVYAVPTTSPERWMGQNKGLEIFSGPHIGAVFAEYDGATYTGPTFDPAVVSGRLTKALEFYEREDWEGGYVRDRQYIRDAETHAGIDMNKLMRPSGGGSGMALISSDLDEMYAFFLPITARFWKAVTGYRTAAILVGPEDLWNEGKFGIALRELRAVGAKVFFVPGLEGHRDSTVAQVSRLYAGCLPLSPTDYILTSDVDMWPLGPAHFQVDPNSPLHILYANAYMKSVNGRLVPEGMYPICYVGATVANWRKVMKVDGDLTASIKRQLDEGLGRGAPAEASWRYDEVLLGLRIQESGLLPHAQLKNRTGQPPRDRMDRSGWPSAEPVGAVDAHVLRPGHEMANWTRLEPLIKAKLGIAGLEWARSYRDAYTGASPA